MAMSMEFYDRQSTLHQEIARELIRAVPPEWDAAILEVDVYHTSGCESCAHLIYDPKSGSGPVPPSAPLLEATDRLMRLFRESETCWRHATFGVWRARGEGWQSTVQVC